MGASSEDAVAAIDQQLADQIERLLRAGGDEDIVGAGDDAVAGKVAGNHLAQRLIAFGGAVLQRLGAVLGEDFMAGFVEALTGKDVGGGKASAKGNDVRASA